MRGSGLRIPTSLESTTTSKSSSTGNVDRHAEPNSLTLFVSKPTLSLSRRSRWIRCTTGQWMPRGMSRVKAWYASRSISRPSTSGARFTTPAMYSSRPISPVSSRCQSWVTADDAVDDERRERVRLEELEQQRDHEERADRSGEHPP